MMIANFMSLRASVFVVWIGSYREIELGPIGVCLELNPRNRKHVYIRHNTFKATQITRFWLFKISVLAFKDLERGLGT